MKTSKHTLSIPNVHNNGSDASKFGSRKIDLLGTQERMLSDQISALNFRLRTSQVGYYSDWHVAGDPTLLLISTGIMRVELHSGETQEFSAGNMFIAEDYLESDIEFNTSIHGHRAKVIGETPFSALHLKLEKRTTI